MRIRQIFGLQPFSVISDPEGEPAVFDSDADADGIRAGMAGDIGENLLKDAEDGEGLMRTEAQAFAQALAAARNAGARLELLNLPFYGGRKPEIAKDTGTQLGSDAADGIDRDIDVADEAGDACRKISPHGDTSTAVLEG